MSIKTRVAIIIPEPDLAANTIWNELYNQSYFKETNQQFDDKPVFQHTKYLNDIKILHSKKDGVASNHLDSEIEAELYIFASRHRAASGTPALLIHPTGNWNQITLEGREKELSYTSAFALKHGLKNLVLKQEEFGLEDFKVDLEVTHHGPTELKTPLVFMELGSSEEFWVNSKAALAVGQAIMETAEEFIKRSKFKGISYIGFGGNHYAYRFRKHVVANEEVYVSHIAAKHTLDNLTDAIILEAFEKTIEKPKGALIDKKGAKSEQRKKIIEIVESSGKECIQI
ncbi:MAG: D-aminoacyl-tRNA deacylase [Candidatus Heimdallarchaeota archaeon]|nr:D-aminoacyl-tRNA deacylase [Candidatus Heimdallarchaeota archaeon]